MALFLLLLLLPPPTVAVHRLRAAAQVVEGLNAHFLINGFFNKKSKYSMKHIISLLTISAFLITSNAIACTSPVSVCSQASQGSFSLINKGRPVSVVLETSADPAVQRVVKSFAQDLKRVSGKKAPLTINPKHIKKPAVLIAVLGQSALIDALIAAGKLTVDKLAGQWEAFQVAVVENPWPTVDRVLVIVGSDRRGAIYGTYDLSEKLGVSPWYWFADVPTVQQSQIYITSGVRNDQPKVRYRGLFINDEDPALSGWAKKQFGGVNADMYVHVFELILRLKGNYLWPAMWGKQFHVDDPRNTELADEMGIVIGTSHHEPMTRAHAEWHPSPDHPHIGGAWNYETNAENLRQFWRGGIERMMSKGDGAGYDSLVTVGMRGDGDEPMSENTAINLLETIVADQRKILAKVSGKPINEIPQVWALYKEVQSYYDKGMTVPDDVTLLFADDNWGQIRRLPTDNLNRAGGYGVYYHFDYVGAPRNYKWTNTVQIEKVWQQMNLAYERGARNIWVVNVGDIKPVEFPLDFFLAMAWNPEAMTTDALAAFSKNWAADAFGKNLAADVGELLTRYGQYASMRKPELINEKTFAIGEVTNLELKRGEFYKLVDQWQVLVKDMEKVKARITPEQTAAFFQVVEFPIASLANLYEMYFAVAWNRLLASQHDARANYFREKVEKAYAYDTALTDQYHKLNDGKWDGMMTQVHMNYVIWNDPTEQTMPPIVRVGEGRNDIDVVFSAKSAGDKRTRVLEASAFERSVSGNGISWQAIANLGQSQAAMMTLPQGMPATTVDDGVRLEYNIATQVAGDVQVALQLSPTLDTRNNGGIRIGVSIDDSPVKTLVYNLIPTGGTLSRPEERAWSDAVVNNRHTVSAEFTNVSKGEHTLKVWRLDENIVLEKIAVKTYGEH